MAWTDDNYKNILINNQIFHQRTFCYHLDIDLTS
jgi:hypothetical protein